MRIKRTSSAVLLSAVILFLLSPLYIDRLVKFYESITRVDHHKQVQKYYDNPDVPVPEKFLLAVSEGDIKRVAEFIEKGADVSARDESGGSALHTAAMRGYLDIVKYLVARGVNVNARDGFERTPLMFAAQYGKPEVISFLIDKGADVNAKDVYGHTALSCARETGEDKTAAYLVKKGAAGRNVK